MIRIYRQILGVNIFLILLGLLVFILVYNPSISTPSEENEIDSNPLRIAQLRVDFPILAIHDPHARIEAFHYPKSRHFADQEVGIGMRYRWDDKDIILKQFYRDLNPLSHTFEGYKDEEIDGKNVKINHEGSLASIAWFYDLGVYELKGNTSIDNLKKLYKNTSGFIPVDEKEVEKITQIFEGKPLKL